MDKVYLVVNESGNESTVTKEMYEYLDGKKGYECRIESPQTDNQYGDYRIEEKGGGYKNVVHIETGEVQNEKGLKEDKAIELAKKLA